MSEPSGTHKMLLTLPEVSIYKEQDTSLLIFEADGIVPSEAYRKSMATLLQETHAGDSNNWLIICKNDTYISPEDREWTASTVVSKIVGELNLQKIAIVEPVNIFTRISLMQMMERLSSASSRIEVQFFEKKHNARNWLNDNNQLDF
mgnify:CR=1 FL=1